MYEDCCFERGASEVLALRARGYQIRAGTVCATGLNLEFNITRGFICFHCE